MCEGDTNRKLVGKIGQYGLIYHVINEGGEPYTIIEDSRTGVEIGSTPTENEQEMINYYITDSPYILSDLEEERVCKKLHKHEEIIKTLEAKI